MGAELGPGTCLPLALDEGRGMELPFSPTISFHLPVRSISLYVFVGCFSSPYIFPSLRGTFPAWPERLDPPIPSKEGGCLGACDGGGCSSGGCAVVLGPDGAGGAGPTSRSLSVPFEEGCVGGGYGMSYRSSIPSSNPVGGIGSVLSGASSCLSWLGRL